MSEGLSGRAGPAPHGSVPSGLVGGPVPVRHAATKARKKPTNARLPARGPAPSVGPLLLQLQRTAGNRALAALTRPAPSRPLPVQRRRTSAREHEPEELFRERAATYDKCRTKGAGLWGALQAALSQTALRAPTAPSTHPHYLDRYRTTLAWESGYLVVRAFRKDDTSSGATPLYRNDFHPNGEIVAKANYGNEDRAWRQEGVLHNSEILANQRHLANLRWHEERSLEPAPLRVIKRDTVQNSISISVAEIVHPPEDEDADVRELTTLPGTEDFDALLGTPNGAVQAHLLSDHVADFRATIASISTLMAHQDSDYSRRRLNYMTFAMSAAAPVAASASGSGSGGSPSTAKNATLRKMFFG